MDKQEISKIRRELKMTQNQLSRFLCVSPKAIQSFEQGWRDVPTHVEREILLLLSLIQSGNVDRTPTPCWEIRNCPSEWRAKCIVWEYKMPHFCFIVNGTFCQGEFKRTWDEKIEECKKCEVFQKMVTI